MNEKVINQNNNSSDQLKQFYEITQEIVTQIQQGIRVKKEIPQEAIQLKEQLKPVIQSVSATGEINAYNWLHLRSLIVISTRDMLNTMQKVYPYEKNTANEGFEDEMDIILQFLCVFENKPPFTLQRICELLLNPEKHYKSSRKLLFAMEKLVNVSN